MLIGVRRALLAGVKRAAGAISSMLLSQNWDGVTAPALPAGWVFPPANSNVSITNTAISFSGTNCLKQPSNTDNITHYVYTPAIDTNNGDVVARANFYFDTPLNAFQDAAVFIRAAIQSDVNRTSYQANIDIAGGTVGLGLAKVIAGTATGLGSVNGAGIFVVSTWYMVEISAIGTTISSRVKRLSDGTWLNSAGVWTPTESTAISVTDSSISGAGYAGVQLFSGSPAGKGTRTDDFKLFAAASPQAPATQLFVTPSNPATLSGFANHVAYPLWISSDGSRVAPLTVTLSDGGIGGRFFNGIRSYTPVTSVALPPNTAFAEATVFYVPPYNRTSQVTITASSSLGNVSVPLNITAYPTTGAPTPANLSFDQNALATFANQWSALPRDISGGFVAGLAGYTKISDVNGGVETISGGVYSRLNAGQANTVFYKSNTGLISNAYNIELQISAWGGGTTDQIFVGAAVDGSNYIAAVVDNFAGTIQLFSVVAGTFTQLGSTVAKSLAVGTKVCLGVGAKYQSITDAKATLWYQQPGETAYTLAVLATTNAYNWTTVAGLAAMFPFWGTKQAANTSVKVTNFTTGHSGTYIAPANNTVAKDITTGAPLLTPDGTSIYVVGGTSTGGGASNTVYAMNTQTLVFTEVARVIANDSTYAGLGPVSLAFNPGTATWTVFGANWTTNLGVAPIVPSYGTTTADLLAGANVVTLAPLPLPSTAASGAGSPVTVYDADVIFQGGTYTVVYVITNGGISWIDRAVAMATATSLAGPFTQQWQTTLLGGRYDGTRISQIGGIKVAMGGNFLSTPALNVFNLTTGASLGALQNITLDTTAPGNSFVPGSLAVAWPSLAPIPGEIVGQTRYVLPLFQQIVLDVTGLPKVLPPTGGLWCFEATQRYTSAEFTWITAS